MHRPIKVTRAKGYHLTGSKQHQPITNLAGNGEPVERIDFDGRDGTTKVDTKARAAAVGAKVAADAPTPFDQMMSQRLFTPDSTGASPIDQLLRQNNPQLTPAQLAAESARLKANPQEAETLYAQQTGNQALLEAGSYSDMPHSVASQVQDDGGGWGSALSEASNALIPGSGLPSLLARGVGDTYAPIKLQSAVAGAPIDTALTADQLRWRDQNRIGSEADVQSQLSRLQDAANRGQPGAAEHFQQLSQQLPKAMATANSGADITQQHLDHANAVGESAQLQDTVQDGLTSVFPGALPMGGALGAKKQITNAWDAYKAGQQPGSDPDAARAASEQSIESAAEHGAGYLGMRALGSSFTQNAAALPSAKPTSFLSAAKDRFNRSWKPFSAPNATPEQLAAAKATQAAGAAGAGGDAAETGAAPSLFSRARAMYQGATDLAKRIPGAQSPVAQRLLQPAVDFSKARSLGAVGNLASRAAAPVAEGASMLTKAAPWLGTAGRVMGRLGAVGAVGNAAVRVGQGLRFANTEQGQQEYADGVQAQTEADATRTPFQKVKDVGGAVGSLALGDPWHASHLIAENWAGDDYKNAIRSNAMGGSIAAKELPGHMKALQSYFPNVAPDQLTQVARHAAQQSDNNYQLFHGNDDKPYPAGISSFEKRLNDPQGPYAQLPANVKGVYRDLGRRLGGTTAEGLVSDPTWQAQLDPKAQPQPYSTPHISYAPQPDMPPQAPQQPAAPAKPVVAPPQPTTFHRSTALAAPVAQPTVSRRAPAIKVPPPPEPSAGMAPIGQPFSPMRATKSAMAKRAAAATPPAPAPAPAPIAPQAAATPQQPLPPMASAAPRSTTPKTAPSHPFGAARPAIQPQQPEAAPPVAPQTAPAPAPVSPAGESPAPAAPTQPQPPAAAAQPYDWKGFTAPVPAGQDASAVYAQRVQDGLLADAGLPEAQKTTQMQAREDVLGTPGARIVAAQRLNDPSLADPKTPYADYEKKLLDDGSKGYADKLQANLTKLPAQSPGDFMKNNWQLALIPIGLAMALSGGNTMTKIMGVLATVGGGMGLYSRYQALQTPEFKAYLQKSVAGKTTPQEDAQFKQPMQDLALASKSGAVDLPALVKQHIDTLWQNAQPKVAPTAPAPTLVSEATSFMSQLGGRAYNFLHPMPAAAPAAAAPPAAAPVTQ